MTGLFGGSFNPPHLGHVALARAALERYHLERLVVLVSARPAHKEVDVDAATRLRLAELAFGDLPRTEVELDEHARTIDTLRDGRFDGALFLIGADELCDFLEWKDPNGVLEHVRVAVASRPGFRRERLDAVLERLERPERVEFFEIEPLPISSRAIREGRQPVADAVPPAVAAEIERLGLYRA